MSELQNMFGRPIPRPIAAIILPFVCTYLTKEDPITSILKRKARATCNGGKKDGKAVAVAETYATCVEQPACRVYWAMTAQLCLIALGADAGNAFAEAPPATEPFYMRIDDQFREWCWTECKGCPPIPPGYVLPVNHALQGHPEAPRLWERHIHDILVKQLHFVPTTHEKCLYSQRDAEDKLQMILRQVDDFSVSATEQQDCRDIIEQIGTHLTVPLNDLGIIRKFNVVNIQQTKWYIKISCEDYLLKILQQHDWLQLKAAALPIPMRSDSKYQRELETTAHPTTPDEQHHIQQQAGFSFLMASTGELIYALIVARMEISFAIIKLSQYNANPALIHYKALREIFAYLNHTREDGLIYWRSCPRQDLPEVTPTPPQSNPQDRLPTYVQPPLSLLAYTSTPTGAVIHHTDDQYLVEQSVYFPELRFFSVQSTKKQQHYSAPKQNL